MQHRLTVWNRLCAVGLLLTTVGCGGGNEPVEGRPATLPVSGKVTYMGAAVEGASVSFVAGKEGQGAAGRTDAEGVYHLTTFNPQDGAVPGDYQVTVTKDIVVGADNSYGDVNSPNYGKTPPKGAEGHVEHKVPEKYGQPGTSMLTATVKEGEDNTFDFELKD